MVIVAEDVLECVELQYEIYGHKVQFPSSIEDRMHLRGARSVAVFYSYAVGCERTKKESNESL